MITIVQPMTSTMSLNPFVSAEHLLSNSRDFNINIYIQVVPISLSSSSSNNNNNNTSSILVYVTLFIFRDSNLLILTMYLDIESFNFLK